MMSFNFKDFDPPCHHYILGNNIILTSIKIYYLKWKSILCTVHNILGGMSLPSIGKVLNLEIIFLNVTHMILL